MRRASAMPDRVQWNMAMNVFAKRKLPAECERWFAEMRQSAVRPNEATYSILVNARGRVGDVAGAERWFGEMLAAGVRAQEVSYSCVVGACARSSQASKAEQWLGEMLECAIEADHVSCNTVINACARQGRMERAEQWLEQMLQMSVPADEVSYNSVINACAKQGEARRAERWLERMREAGVQADKVTYGSVVDACARAGEAGRAEHWLERMLEDGVPASAVSLGAAVNAHAQRGDVDAAEALLDRMLSAKLPASEVSYSCVINACARKGQVERAEQWFARMSGDGFTADAVAYSSMVNACAQRGSVEAAERWLERMLEVRLGANAVVYNCLINACARAGQVALAEQWLERMLAAGVQADEVSYGSVRKACARMGEVDRAEEWLERAVRSGVKADDEAWQDVSGNLGRTGGPLKKALYTLRSEGDFRIVEHLERALEYQWVYGYPRVPPGELQLTHGTFKYIAGMQPMAAREMLKLVPHARRVLDPFCGSGTVLIESLVAGKDAVGCDASPLAIFAASHHCDVGRVDAQELVRAAEGAAAELERTEEDWRLVRQRVAASPAGALREALWFCLAVALHTAAGASDEPGSEACSEPPGRLAEPYFLSAAYRYAARLRALREAAPGPHSARLHHGDNRKLHLEEPADAVITSPPYPGIYDYSATARLARRLLGSAGEQAAEGFLGAESGEAFDAGREIGARKLWKRSGQTFLQAWQAQQEQWLGAVHRNLRPGGTATLMIGDGEDDAVDWLASTVDAAQAVGFAVVATSTIESCADAAHQTKGMLRTEHMVHLRRE